MFRSSWSHWLINFIDESSEMLFMPQMRTSASWLLNKLLLNRINKIFNNLICLICLIWSSSLFMLIIILLLRNEMLAVTAAAARLGLPRGISPVPQNFPRPGDGKFSGKFSPVPHTQLNLIRLAVGNSHRKFSQMSSVGNSREY